MSTYIETVTQSTTPSEHQQRDVSWALSHVEPDRVALDTLLRRAPRGPKPIQVKVEWAEDETWPRTDTVSEASAAGSATAAVNVPVSNPSRFRKNDTLIVPTDASKGQLLVEAVGATYVTVRQLGILTAANPTGFGTVPAFDAGTVLAWTGSTLHEGGFMTSPRATMPAYASNHCELMDATVKWSKTREATKNYTNQQDPARTREQQLAEFRRSIEYKLWFGIESVTLDSTNSELRWTMNGVTRYITKQFEYYKNSVGSPAITESMLIDWLAEVFAGNNGSDTRFLFADTYLLANLEKVDLLNQKQRTLTTVYGVKVTRIETDFGQLYIKHHRGFNEMGYSNYGVILDMEQIEKRDLRPMETVPLKLEEAGYDLTAEQWKEQATVLVRKAMCHAIIQGVNVVSG